MRDNLAYIYKKKYIFFIKRIFNGEKFEAKSKEYVLYDLLNNHLSNIESFIEECFKNRHLDKSFRFYQDL